MIGVYDSGLGGLLELNKIRKDNPQSDILYIGDQKNAPYGNKDREEVKMIIENNFDFFRSFGIKDIILACNTVCSLVDFKRHDDLILYDIIKATIDQLDVSLNAKILVFATKTTCEMGRYQKELALKGYQSVYVKALDELAGRLERFEDEGKIKEYLYAEFKTISFKPDIMILGCTHFPIVKYLFEEYYQVPVYDSTALDFKTDDLKGNGRLYLLMDKSLNNLAFINKYVCEKVIFYE